MTINFLREEIQTPRLHLCYPTEQISRDLENLWRDKTVRRFLGGVVEDDVIKQKIVGLQSHWERYRFGQWGVIERSSKRIIGLCGLHHSDDGIELSYMLFPEFWGKGLAYEAVSNCVDYAFNILSINIIIAITQEANTKSCQLLKKIGMKPIKNFERFNARQSLFQITKSDQTFF